MADLTEISRSKFIALLRESGLLDAAELSKALATAPDSQRAKHLARHMMAKGFLTRFQAQHLLAGHSGGFFLGQYRVLDLIGRGGMGKVYKAEHMTMRREVALKVLAADVTRTDRARQLFRQEVRAAARLVHPNIATAYDANEVNGRAFLVLEYVAGPSLSALVREQGPLLVGQACEFIRQAALGLQYAHELGMVHRDIKPSNLLVQPPMGRDSLTGATLKIVDFGLALLPGADEESDSDRHIVLGTPDYLSPEQSRDIRSVDVRSDLYGLGCTLYFLLSGQVPFPGGTPLEKIARHATEQPPAVDAIRPIVPSGVAAAVKRLMAKEPADRFQTPQELADVMARYSEIHPIKWSGRRAESSPSLPAIEEAPTGEATPEAVTVPPNISGTLSIADFAAALSSAEKVSLRPVDEKPERSFYGRFFLALGLGFLLGIVLIAVMTYFRS